MKKTLLFFATVLLCMSAMAKPVDANTARRVATTQMRINGGNTQLTDVTSQSTFTNFYIFTAEGGGFVLVSADDCVVPILGFSTTATFDAKRIPGNVSSVLQEYEEEIAYWKEMDGMPTHYAWRALQAGVAPEPVDPTAVAPLLATTWDQDPYYNDLCPYDNTYSERTVTGCVATATAQIMKKWNHPTTGYGSHSYVASNSHTSYGTLSANFGSTTYQWSMMPNALTSTSSNAQKTAVATLMYHIGVADEMTYDVSANGGSGASNYNYFGYVDDATSENSLQKYFKYRSDMAAIAREDYSNSAYIALLKTDLNAGRPILFSGRDASAGHSFVCDGYNNSNQFHINWGWGGYYDGYFAMGSLNPDGGGTGSNTGTYNLQNVALTRIQPNTNWSSTGSTTVTANATGGSGCSVQGAGSYSFGDTVQLRAVAADGYHFTGWSDGSKFNPRQFIANGGTLSFTAQFEALGGDTITYCPGNRYLTSLGANGTTYWGIRIPASALASGNALTKVQFYATETGSHTLTVYSGTSSPSTSLYTQTFNVTGYGWKTINVGSVTPTSGQDMWITFSSATDYPAAMSYSGGHNYGLLMGSSFSYAGYSQCSFMIRGIFGTGSTPTPPPADSCNITSFPYNEGFENTSTLSCWRVIDGNSDSNSWRLIQSIGSGDNAVTPRTGSYMIGSFSWNSVAYNVNEYLVMPPVTVPASGVTSISWWFRVNGTYPEDKLALKVTTASNPSASDFTTTLIDITPTSANGTWTNQTVDLSAYAGQTITLAFHHHDSYDYNYIVLDDISITNTSAPVQYTITVQSANPTMGSVSGGGTYNAGTTATISATAFSGYHFTQWQDGNTQATRTITVSGNATYTASFAANSAPSASDTISYCDTNSYASSIGTGTPGTIYWGISLTPTLLSGHNYLKSVMLYVTYAGNYTLTISTGGTTAPGTTVHTQDVTFNANQLGWQEILLDATMQINASQNLWITFYSSDVAYPAAGCNYVNNTNSDWVSTNGTAWDHLQNLAATLTYSWLIKAVTTQSAPALPAPTIAISGPTGTRTGVAQTFTATASAGATINWILPGATPSTATGSSVTATWNTPGTYNIIATATNTSGIGYDTLTVNVVSCGTVTTFPYTITFEESDRNLAYCWTMLDADNDGYTWTTDYFDGYVASASFINQVGALTPDNWLISPQMQFTTGSNYTLSWTVGAVDSTYYAEHYGVYISTTGTATSNFTLLQQYTLSTANLTNMTLDLSAYAGQNVYIAFRHWNVTDQYWMVLDNISVTQTAIPGQNYTITVQSANPTMGSVSGGGTFAAGSTTTISATANAGYHFTQWSDGNTQATRTVTVTGNATYIASFASDAPTQYTITAVSNNNAWGTVSGGGTYNAGATATLVATANSGYRFVQWQDGNTQATRTITVNADATYIATFAAEAPTEYTITVLANNDSWGNVTGGGTYTAGSTVTINAIPYNGYQFVQWQDGNTNALRTFTVNADATYIATFAAATGIDDAQTDSWTVYPNPATDAVTITGVEQAEVNVTDMTGRTVATGSISADSRTIDVSTLPSGAYFLRITSGDSSAVRKLIIK